MTKHETDWAWGIGAVSTRRPFGSEKRSKTSIAAAWYRGARGRREGRSRAAAFAQPEWLAAVPSDRRLPPGRHAAVGCGTSFHAAQTTGNGIDALEAVLAPPEADLLVLVSHEGGTPMTVEAARAFPGPKWLVTGAPRAPSRSSATRSSSHALRRGELLPHGRLHLRGRGARRPAR